MIFLKADYDFPMRNSKQLNAVLNDFLSGKTKENKACYAKRTLRRYLSQNQMEQQRMQVYRRTAADTEYFETLDRRLIEKSTVYDEKLTEEFKSGFTVDVDA